MHREELLLVAVTPTPSRPRIFYGWYIVAASVFCNAVLSAAFFQGFSAFFLPIERTFNWNRTAISGAVSLRQVESGVFAPVVGILVDRIGARRLIIGGALVTGAGLVMMGLTNGLLMLYAAFLVVSLGTGGVSHAVTWPTIISRWFRRKRGLAMGLAVMGPMVGSPFVILNATLAEEISWRVILVSYGLITAIAVSCVGFVARDRPEPYGYWPDGEPPENLNVNQKQLAEPNRSQPDLIEDFPEPGLTVRQAIRTRSFWLLSLYLGGMFAGNSALQAHQIPYLVNERGFTDGAAAATLTIVFMASSIGRIGAGALIDIMDYRRVLVIASLMMASSFLYLQFFPVTTITETLPYALLFGISFGSTVPMRGLLSSITFGTRSLGSLIGLLQTTTVIASFVGPLMLGVVFDIQGGYSFGIWILIIIVLAMIPPTMFMKSADALTEVWKTT